jgi:hypothetical protein
LLPDVDRSAVTSHSPFETASAEQLRQGQAVSCAHAAAFDVAHNSPTAPDTVGLAAINSMHPSHAVFCASDAPALSKHASSAVSCVEQGSPCATTVDLDDDNNNNKPTVVTKIVLTRELIALIELFLRMINLMVLVRQMSVKFEKKEM